MKNWAVYIAVALGVVVYGAVTEVDRDGSGAIVGEGSVNAFEVRVGDCFNDADSFEEEITSLPGVPCSEPHDNEAFAVFDVTLDNYPEEEVLSELAFDACMERFEPFVGKEYESSTLDIFTMYPTSRSWKQNDREVVCAVYEMNAGKLVDSVKGRAL